MIYKSLLFWLKSPVFLLSLLALVLVQIGESCPSPVVLFLSPCTCSGVPIINNMVCRKLDVFLDPGTYFWVAKICIVRVAKKAFKGVVKFFFLLILLDLLHFTGN